MTKPFYRDREKDGWTFQCSHEPHKSVMIVPFGKGEIVLCQRCARKIFLKYISTTVGLE